jgi:hypothetical protein
MLSYGHTHFGSFYYSQALFVGNKIYQTRCLTEHIPSIMPKYLYNSLWSVQLFIHNFIIRLFQGMTRMTAVAMIAVMMIISLWAHTTRAEAPEVSAAPTTPVAVVPTTETLVDGMTVAERAAKIDAFYVAKGDLPLAGHGLAFVQAADKYGIDWLVVRGICRWHSVERD